MAGYRVLDIDESQGEGTTKFAFNANTQANGWGAATPARLQATAAGSGTSAPDAACGQRGAHE